MTNLKDLLKKVEIINDKYYIEIPELYVKGYKLKENSEVTVSVFPLKQAEELNKTLKKEKKKFLGKFYRK